MPPYGASEMGERWRLGASEMGERGRDLVEKLDYHFVIFWRKNWISLKLGPN